VTTCPLCQINLEAYQARISKAFGRRIRIPVLYFTQLLGLALGAGERELGMHLNLVPLKIALPRVAEAAHV
jgi:heterodisulfide reductase subunit B